MNEDSYTIFISIPLVQKTLLVFVEKYAWNMYLCARTAQSR